MVLWVKNTIFAITKKILSIAITNMIIINFIEKFEIRKTILTKYFFEYKKMINLKI